MFSSVRIQNFRQFKDLELKNLGRINLITGQNNTGKTSLLEALFLLIYPDDPSRTVTLANLRGVGRSGPETPELWEWLFTDRDQTQTIEIGASEEEAAAETRHSKLQVRLARGSHLPVSAANGAGVGAGQTSMYVTAADPLPGLLFTFSGPNGESLDTSLRWTNQGLLLDPDRRFDQRAAKPGFFLSDAHQPSERDADRLSELELNGREASVIEALRIVEPRLKRLTILTHGGRPSVYADLGKLPLVPLAMMGKGFSRLLTIMSALTLTKGTTVLIDELENGFHYRTLPSIWQAMASAAVEHEAQVFVTTHSQEAIEAAVEGSEGYEGSLAFYRLERRGGGIEVVMGEDRRLRSAVSVGFELR